jgi:hypothetical protein
MRAFVLSLTIVAGFWLASDAKAQTTNSTITRWGLLGTWAVNCNIAPDGGAGGRLTYVIRQGKPVHQRNFGDRKDEGEILRATVAPDNSIELRVHFPALKEIREYALSRESDQTMRAKYNRGPDGTYSIFDGKLVSSGQRAQLQTRCNPASRPQSN